MSLVVLFKSLKFVAKRAAFVTDNAAFQIHYRFTCAMLLVCSIMVSARQVLDD